MFLMTTETQALKIKVAQVLQDFWEDYVGVRPDSVWVIVDRRTIVVLLEEVLAPAEQQITRTEAGRLTFQQFEDRIMAQIRPHLQQVVAEVVGQDVILKELHLDILTRSVLGLFLWNSRQLRIMELKK